MSFAARPRSLFPPFLAASSAPLLPLLFSPHFELQLADLAASVGRLEQQLPKLSLDKWAESALLQLGRANLLMGLAGASSKPGGGGGSSRRSSIT